MVKLNKISSGFDATTVLKHLFGNGLLIKDFVSNIGLSFGLKKAYPLDNCVSSQVTAKTSLHALKTTGFIKHRPSRRIIPNTSMLSLMVPTFTSKDALSL